MDIHNASIVIDPQSPQSATEPRKGEGAPETKETSSVGISKKEYELIVEHINQIGIENTGVFVRVVGAIGSIRVKRSWGRPSLRFSVLLLEGGPDFSTWTAIGSYDRKRIGRKDLHKKRKA